MSVSTVRLLKSLKLYARNARIRASVRMQLVRRGASVRNVSLLSLLVLLRSYGHRLSKTDEAYVNQWGALLVLLVRRAADDRTQYYSGHSYGGTCIQ